MNSSFAPGSIRNPTAAASAPLLGIHHVTAIASDPTSNVNFYVGLLGLRLVKRTVNFDDPSAYHLYYGDRSGTPGSIVTFFYWPGAPGTGRVGPGQSTRISFSADPSSLDYWAARLAAHGVPAERRTRFGEDVIAFHDPDRIPVEIVAVPQDVRRADLGSGVPREHALRGLHTTELTVRTQGPTETLLTDTMGYRLVARDGSRARFETGRGGPGTYIDVVADPSSRPGLCGVGTIHHVAWRVSDEGAQREWQARLAGAGYHVSPVLDRSYFRSIYYRGRGGILFEIATDEPGFATDESLDTLGQTLQLPPQFERARAEIERVLPALPVPPPSNAAL